MRAHEPLANRPERYSLRIGELRQPNSLSGEKERVLAQEVLDLLKSGELSDPLPPELESLAREDFATATGSSTRGGISVPGAVSLPRLSSLATPAMGNMSASHIVAHKRNASWQA